MTAIRPARSDDLDRLLGIVRAAILHMEAQGIHQWDDIYPDRKALNADIQKQHIHIVEVDGHIAGMISINDEQSPEYQNVQWRYPGKALVVHRLTIDPVHQRQGLATRLMQFAEKTAELGACKTIRLDAFTQNPGATGLYEQLGYEKAGTVQFRKGLFFCFEKPVSNPSEKWMPEPASGAYVSPVALGINMKSTEDVFWLGGSPCCGKSSVASLLHQRFGIHYYKCDDHFDRHLTEGSHRGFTTCSIVKQSNHEYVFMRSEAQVLQLPFDIYSEEFELILEDIHSLPRPLLVEGCALLPERLRHLGVSPKKAFYMVPKESFFREQYQKRTWAHDRLRETSDPVRAFENWMNRDVAFAHRIAEQAQSNGYSCVWIDGSRTVPEAASEAARHFEFGSDQG